MTIDAAWPAIARSNGIKSRARSVAASAVTRGSATCKSSAVEPWPGKCFTVAATPARSKPCANAPANAPTRSGSSPYARVDTTTLRGCSERSATGARSTLIPSRARSRPTSVPSFSASATSPVAPTAIADGSAATPSCIRSTRPPSWSTVISGGGDAVARSAKTRSRRSSVVPTLRANRISAPGPNARSASSGAVPGVVPVNPTPITPRASAPRSAVEVIPLSVLDQANDLRDDFSGGLRDEDPDLRALRDVGQRVVAGIVRLHARRRHRRDVDAALRRRVDRHHAARIVDVRDAAFEHAAVARRRLRDRRRGRGRTRRRRGERGGRDAEEAEYDDGNDEPGHHRGITHSSHGIVPRLRRDLPNRAEIRFARAGLARFRARPRRTRGDDRLVAGRVPAQNEPQCEQRLVRGARPHRVERTVERLRFRVRGPPAQRGGDRVCLAGATVEEVTVERVQCHAMRFALRPLALAGAIAIVAAAPAPDPLAGLAALATANGHAAAVHLRASGKRIVDGRTILTTVEQLGAQRLVRRCINEVCAGTWFDGEHEWTFGLNDVVLPEEDDQATLTERTLYAIVSYAFAEPAFRGLGGTVARDGAGRWHVRARDGLELIATVDPGSHTVRRVDNAAGRPVAGYGREARAGGAAFALDRSGPLEQGPLDEVTAVAGPLGPPAGVGVALGGDAPLALSADPIPIVPCNLGGRGVHCLLDTGATPSAMTLAMAETLGLEPHGELEISGIGRFATGYVEAGPLVVGPAR